MVTKLGEKKKVKKEKVNGMERLIYNVHQNAVGIAGVAYITRNTDLSTQRLGIRGSDGGSGGGGYILLPQREAFLSVVRETFAGLKLLPHSQDFADDDCLLDTSTLLPYNGQSKLWEWYEQIASALHITDDESLLMCAIDASINNETWRHPSYLVSDNHVRISARRYSSLTTTDPPA